MNQENTTGYDVRGEGEGMLSPARPMHMQQKNQPLKRLVGFGIMLVGSAAMILCLLLLIFPLFHVKSIEVVGNAHHTSEEIIEIAGIEEGMEVFAVDAKKTADALLDASPYIQSCKVSVYPFSVKLEIVEKSHVMYTEHDGGYISFEFLPDSTLRVLEALEDSDTVDDFPHATLPDISSASVGGNISFRQATVEVDYMKSIIDVLEEYGLYDSVVSMDLSSRTNVFFEIEGGCRIKLGTARDLDDKIVEVLNQLQNNRSVIEIDVSDPQEPSIKTY